VRPRPGDLPVLDLVGLGLLRLALLLAIRVDVRVRQDPVQPRLEVRARLILVEGGEGLGERLLDQVLGIRRVTRHPQGSRVQLVEEGQRLAFEARSPFVGRLGGRCAASFLCHHGRE